MKIEDRFTARMHESLFKPEGFKKKARTFRGPIQPMGSITISKAVLGIRRMRLGGSTSIAGLVFLTFH
jgi:hypothetical protein